MLSCFSHVQLFVTLRTVTHQAPLSMEFSRQEYWSGLPCPPPADFPYSGIEPKSLMFPALAGRFFTTSTTWDAQYITLLVYNQDVSRTGLLRGLWEKELLQASLLGLQKALFLYTYLCPIHSHHLVLLPLPSTTKHYIYTGLNTKTQYIKHFLAMIGSEVKASACNAEDPGVIPGSGRSPGEGNGNPLPYSCLENPMEGGAW